MQFIHSRHALLFVYGTLMQAFNNEYALFLKKHSVSIDKAVFQGQMYWVKNTGSFQYPAVVESRDPTDKVFGELYRLREPLKVFGLLDVYEGCASHSAVPHEYKRTRRRVYKQGGQTMSAYIYLYCQPVVGLTRINSGDFNAFMKRGY